MNPIAIIAGLGTLAATTAATGDDFRPMGVDRAVKRREISCLAVVLFISLHMPLALLMKVAPSVATLHALLAVAIGIKWAWSGRESAKVAYMGAYITGSEIIWRSAGASVFWEYGKYATVLIFVLALIRSHRVRVPVLPMIYLLLLIPATLLTVFQVSPSEAKNMISFNMSGPLALAVSVVFFVRLQLSGRQFLRLCPSWTSSSSKYSSQ